MNPRSLIKKIRLLFINEGEETARAPDVRLEAAPKLAPAPMESTPPSHVRQQTALSREVGRAPLPQGHASIKEQSEWMLGQIGAHAKALVSFAESNGFELAPPSLTSELFHRHDVSALMLGYKITGVAYRLNATEPSREVLRMVRTAMISMLLKAGRDIVQQAARDKTASSSKLHPLNLTMAEDHVKAADAEVLQVVTHLQEKSPHPFHPFTSSLAPAFKADLPAEALDAKYTVFFATILTKTQESFAQRTVILQ
jgi:hypothetical protein